MGYNSVADNTGLFAFV